MQNYINLDGFSAVGAGQVANLVLDSGPKYDEIHLQTNEPEKVEFVRLSLNAVEVFKLEKDELDMFNAYDSVEGTSGFLALPLVMNNAVPLDTKVFTGLETGPGDNVVLEVKFAADAGGPTLSAFANVSAHPGRRDVVRSFERYTVPVAADGKLDFKSIVKGPRILRMWFKSPNIQGLEIKQNSVVRYEMTKERNDYLLKSEGKVVPAGYFVFDPTKRNFPLVDAMRTDFQNLNFRLDVQGGGAQNIEVLVEQLEQIEPRNWSGK